MVEEVAHILAARKQRKEREGPKYPFKASGLIPSPPNSATS